MRKLTFSALLLALLLMTAGVVYAGVTWGDDPITPIGRGYFAHLEAGTGEGVSVVSEEVWGEVKGDEAWARGCARFEGRGEAAVRVWITDGRNDGYPGLGGREKQGRAPGELCVKVEVDLDD